MDISILKEAIVTGDRGKQDFRHLTPTLIRETQKSLQTFSPINKASYSENPIQLLDFFSGAGGTSLGFASLNGVIPAFKLLCGCDIDKTSAATYSHNFDTQEVCQDIIELANDEDLLDSLL